MKMYYNTVTDTAGNIINGATVTVYEDGGAVASIYDYLGSPISNPFLSGLNRSEGEVEFAAESGMYDIKIVHGSETDWIRNETLIDTKDLGPIGGSIPGSLTCTVFTSNGIDDNATGERVQIEDGSINLGTSGASYPITHAANDQSLELVGGGSSGNGGAVKVYGGSHATKAGDIEILSGGNVLAHWDEDNGELIISSGTGAKTEAIRVYSGGVIRFAQTPNVSGSDVLTDDDIGDIVQGYDANTAKTDVANTFTQAQTISRSPVENDPSLMISDTSGSGNRFWIVTNPAASAYNPIVQADDIVVSADRSGAANVSKLVVAPWASHAVGIRMDAAADSLALHGTTVTINGSDAVSATNTLTLTNKTLTSPIINTSVSGTAILDEDNMASDSATKLATQQSIKAYVDTAVAGAGGDPTFKGFRAYLNGTVSGIDDALYLVNTTNLSSLTEDYDTDAWFAPSTGYFQPDEAGYYKITFTIKAQNLASGATVDIQVCKNGGGKGFDTAHANSSGLGRATATTEVYLNGSTDYVTFQYDALGDTSWDMYTQSSVSAYKIGT